MSNQTAMFTTEQMTGSGQSNMLDLIHQNEDRKNVLRQTLHTFWTDPGHGWLEVQHSDLIVLGILGAITGFSYRKGDAVYLEEDMDAGAYIKALFPLLRDDPEYVQWNNSTIVEHKENIFIRNLNQFYR